MKKCAKRILAALLSLSMAVSAWTPAITAEAASQLVNVAPLGTAVTSSGENGDHVIANVNDGDDTTSWQTQGVWPSTAVVQLGRGRTVSEVVVKLGEKGDNSKGRTALVTVEYAQNGVTSDLINIGSYRMTVDSDYTFKLSTPISATHIYVTLSEPQTAEGTTGTFWPSVEEIEVYEEQETAAISAYNNIANQAVITTTGSEHPTDGSNNLVDGSNSTLYKFHNAAMDSEKEIILTYAEARAMNAVRIAFENVGASDSNSFSFTYSILARNGSGAYETIVANATANRTDNSSQEYQFAEKTYSEVKIVMHSCKAGSNNGWPAVAEFEVYGSEVVVVDEANIALGKPVHVSSGKTLARNITDGSVNSTWRGSYYPAYVDINLEKNYNLNTVEVYTPENGYSQYTIYTSMDGRDFTKLAEKTSKDSATLAAGEVYQANGKEARIVRVYLEYNSAETAAVINEVRITGTESESAIQNTPAINVKKFSESKYADTLTVTAEDTYEEVYGIIERRLGEQYEAWFTLELAANPKNTGYDFFELSTVNGKVHVKGNDGVSLATGINHFLKYYCNVNISQVGDQVTMPAQIPAIEGTVHKETKAKVRYSYNYCTLSYSMAFWGKDEWRNELDWLALNGVNVVLDATAQEEVWRRFLGELGYKHEDIKDFIAGPAYYAWAYMANLSGFGGPVHDSWFEERTELARENQLIMRKLGMQPVLQGYSGMVPTDIKDYDSSAQIIEQGKWCSFQRPAMLVTTSSTFDEYAALFYKCQKEVYGDTSDYYATDPFHEGGNTGGMDSKAIAKEVLLSMLNADKDSIWIIQAWQGNPTTALLNGLDEVENGAQHALVLDLYAEKTPHNQETGGSYGDTKEFDDTPWLFCMLNNFGGRLGLHGHLDNLANNIPVAFNNGKYIAGIGITPEASVNNPVLYDFLFETIWQDDAKANLSVIDLNTWLDDYAERRYGAASESANQAWDILKDTVYKSALNNLGQGAPESVVNARPALNISAASTWGNAVISYDKVQLEKAAKLLLEDYDLLKDSEGYLYDVANVLQQILSNSAQEYHSKMSSAYSEGNLADFEKYAGIFMEIIENMETVTATSEYFLLGRWVEQAKALGANADDFTKELYEFNAKALVTTWGSYNQAESGGLKDYSNRQWSGLIGDFYKARWERWINARISELKGEQYETDINWFQWEWEWVRSNKTYSTTPVAADLETLGLEIIKNYTSANPASDDSNDYPANKLKATTGTLEPSEGSLEALFDGDSTSYYHSNWSGTRPTAADFWITMELEEVTTIEALRYLPRQDNANGRILGYEISYSLDGNEWTTISTGTWADDKSWKIAEFEEAVEAKFVKIFATDSKADNSGRHMTAAELRLVKAEAEEKEITVKVGETVVLPGTVQSEPADSGIATTSMEVKKIRELAAGGEYMIVPAQRTHKALTNSVVEGVTTENALDLMVRDSVEDQSIFSWKITLTDAGVYYVQPANDTEKYMKPGSAKLNLVTEVYGVQIQTASHDGYDGFYIVSQDGYGLNVFGGGDNNAIKGWDGRDANSLWEFYSLGNTHILGVTPGTTEATIGGVKYKINVIDNKKEITIKVGETVTLDGELDGTAGDEKVAKASMIVQDLNELKSGDEYMIVPVIRTQKALINSYPQGVTDYLPLAVAENVRDQNSLYWTITKNNDGKYYVQPSNDNTKYMQPGSSSLKLVDEAQGITLEKAYYEENVGYLVKLDRFGLNLFGGVNSNTIKGWDGANASSLWQFHTKDKTIVRGMATGTTIANIGGWEYTITVIEEKDVFIKSGETVALLGDGAAVSAEELAKINTSIATVATGETIFNKQPVLVHNDGDYNTVKGDLNQYLYTFDLVDAETGTYQIYGVTDAGEKSYINIRVADNKVGYPNSLLEDEIKVSAAGNNQFSFVDTDGNNAYNLQLICDWHVFNESPNNPPKTISALELWEVQADETGTSYSYQSVTEIQDGGKYAIVAKCDHGQYIIRPYVNNSSDADRNQMVAKLGTTTAENATEVRFTGVSAGTTSVLVGTTQYNVHVLAEKYVTVRTGETVRIFDQSGTFKESGLATLDTTKATVTVETTAIEEKVAKLYNGTSYDGTAIDLNSCLYTFNKNADGTYTIVAVTDEGETVYLNPFTGTEQKYRGYPSTETPENITIVKGENGFSFLDPSEKTTGDQENYRLTFVNGWKVFNEDPVNDNGTPYTGSTTDVFKVYQAVKSGDKYVYTEVNSLSEIQDGAQCYIVAVVGDAEYVLRPSASTDDTGSRNDHVAQIAASESDMVSGNEMHISGISVGDTEVTVGNTVYKIHVIANEQNIEVKKGQSIVLEGSVVTQNTDKEYAIIEKVDGEDKYQLTGIEKGETEFVLDGVIYHVTVVGEAIASSMGTSNGMVVNRLTMSANNTFDLCVINTEATVVSWKVIDAKTKEEAEWAVINSATGEVSAANKADNKEHNGYIVVELSDGTTIKTEFKLTPAPTVEHIRLYDIYVDKLHHTDVWYGWLYERDNPDGENTSEYTGLTQVLEGEVIYVSVGYEFGTAIDFFARPENGYALTQMRATNTWGHYKRLAGATPEETEFVATEGVAGYVQYHNIGEDATRALVQSAMNIGCHGAQGFTKLANASGDLSTILNYRSEKLPTVTKTTIGVSGPGGYKDNYREYNKDVKVQIGDYVYFKVTVNTYECEDLITYNKVMLEDLLEGAVFVKKESEGYSELSDAKIENVMDITTEIDADSYEAKTHDYYVKYQIQAKDIASVSHSVVNTAELTYEYSTTYSNGVFSSDAKDNAEVMILDIPLNSIVVDYGLPVTYKFDDLTKYELVSDETSYGNVTLDVTEGDGKYDYVLTYTASETLKGVDTISLKIVETSSANEKVGDVKVVGVYPATTVYYEENFLVADVAGQWKFSEVFDELQETAHPGSTTSETPTANYGYDTAYAKEVITEAVSQITEAEINDAKEKVLSRDAIKNVRASSEEDGTNDVENAFDGNPETIWHAQWGNPGKLANHPNGIDVDITLTKETVISKLSYLPRLDAPDGGTIGQYEVYAATEVDGEGNPLYGETPVHRGTFELVGAEERYQDVVFATPVSAKYLRLKAVTMAGGQHPTAAEIKIYESVKNATIKEKATFTFKGTGVDVFANCDANTGIVMVMVKDSLGALKKLYTVDTKLKLGDIDTANAAALGNETTNIPIVSVPANGLTYGDYEILLVHTSKKDTITNEQGVTSTEIIPTNLRIDGFRVYGTLQEAEATAIHSQDNEAAPVYYDMKDSVMAGMSINGENSIYKDQLQNLLSQVYAANAEKVSGAMLVTAGTENKAYTSDELKKDFMDNTSKNELYVYPGQSLVFALDTSVNNPQLAIKALNGTANYTITKKEAGNSSASAVTTAKELSANTEMYYVLGMLTDANAQQLATSFTITNTGTTAISITKLKVPSANATGAAKAFVELTEADLTAALAMFDAEVPEGDGEQLPQEAVVSRISGTDRYETAYKVADVLKETLGVDKFEAVVVATGKNFADALSGSYLATVKNAPILLTNEKRAEELVDYVKANLAEDGTVYILGGTAAVPETVEDGLGAYAVKRLAGATRYETNIAILNEVGLVDEPGMAQRVLLIATGTGFADSLSASAAKKPILLVKDEITEAHKEILKMYDGSKIYIIGGTGVVSEQIQEALVGHGRIFRLAGATRYETSVKVAETFFPDAQSAVLAYAKEFPDGLAGGTLAAAMGAPLILTADGKTADAAAYMQAKEIQSGIVLGGTARISDEAVGEIF